jgi:DNA-binding CsgD family transcriptional regulator
MLQSDFMAVLEARSQEDLRNELLRFTRQLGFDRMTAALVVDRPQGQSHFTVLDNAPEAYAAIFNDPESSLRDPVLQHAKHRSVPIVWDGSTYAKHGVEPLYEEQVAFGYATGIAVALHLPEGRHFAFGVVRDQALPHAELTRMMADLQLFTTCAQEAAVQLLLPPQLQPQRPKLTPRELEVLRWTMDSKTAWEVGAILGISERTAVLHINNAMHKLDCVSKHQAVLKALKLGLIR